MIHSVITDAGYRCGMYTSPHLHRINERIKVGHEEISDKELDRVLGEIRSIARKNYIELTYFEYLTAAAFTYFGTKDLDFAVIETGLGGRLDATNIITPEITIITNVTIDHKDYLGEDVGNIAKEKAGIIKKDSFVISMAKGEALNVIKQACEATGSKLIIPKVRDVELQLKGMFQQENAAIAIEALQELGFAEKTIMNGLKKAKWPGRLESIGKNGKNILIDCAHNAAGIETLVKEIKEMKYNRLILVLGILRDKEIRVMTTKLREVADKVIITRPDVDRASDTMQLAGFFSDCEQIPSVADAVAYAKKIAQEGDLILVTGSIFTVAEARSMLLAQL